jgi:hypothetical protein
MTTDKVYQKKTEGELECPGKVCRKQNSSPHTLHINNLIG